MAIEYFDVSEDWVVQANYQPFETPILQEIENILGFTSIDTIYGTLAFEIDNQSYNLWPLMGANSMFIMFADETSGVSTYGSGRFLSAPLPDANNKVKIDFNKAYNPPCAFSDYATCPLPPLNNILPIEGNAGERTCRQ